MAKPVISISAGCGSTRHLTTGTPNNLCPHCGHHIEAATSFEGKTPTPDTAVSLCISCGSILRFNQDLTVRLASVDEIEDLMSDATARRVVQRLQAEIRRRGPLVSGGTVG
jgi:DNA-directed RNA polymerase subunit RPC12/RpoP